MLICMQLVKKLPPILEPEISVSNSLEPPKYSYPDLDETSLSPAIPVPRKDAGDAENCAKSMIGHFKASL